MWNNKNIRCINTVNISHNFMLQCNFKAMFRCTISLCNIFNNFFVTCFQGLMFLVYPLLGHLTDVYLTRYRTLKCGLVNRQPFAEGICTCSCRFMCVHVCVCVIHAVHSLCLFSLHFAWSSWSWCTNFILTVSLLCIFSLCLPTQCSCWI